MIELKLSISPQQNALLQQRLRERGEDLSSFFTAMLHDSRVDLDNAELQNKVERSIRQSLIDIEEGGGVKAHQAMREIAAEAGLKLPL